MTRWLKRYKGDGLAGLLAVKKAPGQNEKSMRKRSLH
ncbi:hypothetical protein [Umezakia ovalisporum]